MTFSLVCITVAITSADPLPESARKQLQRLQGKWVAVSFEDKDEKYEITKDDDEEILEIKGNKWIFCGVEKGHFIALDSKTNPKCVDFKSVEKGRAGNVDEGIYKIEKDTLTICIYQGMGKHRPTNFDRPKQAYTVLMVFKRVNEK